LSIGATFVARSFSGDKTQLVPILKAGLAHKGLALVDVISPCVTFNDHDGSTKSYRYTREHEVEVVHADYVPVHTEITLPDSRDHLRVVSMHDGSSIRLRSTAADYDPTDRTSAYAHVRACQSRGEIATGLLFVDEKSRDMHGLLKTTATPLVDLPHEQLCPGAAALDALMARYR
ncbi:MAG: 2-oxoacid:ferredoxin oxidoreductase subunit beta, partial [Planctomycetaceae bacterium]